LHGQPQQENAEIQDDGGPAAYRRLPVTRALAASTRPNTSLVRA
jgi:hypothetical protein